MFLTSNYCREDIYSTTSSLSVFSPHQFIQLQWKFVRMYFVGFSTRWWEKLFLVGIFSQDIIKKTPQKHTMSVWNPITLACAPQYFKSFERAFFQNIAWASTQRRKCVFLRVKTRIFAFQNGASQTVSEQSKHSRTIHAQNYDDWENKKFRTQN